MNGDIGIGTILNTNSSNRDAIHIAVAPVEAAHPMSPGLHIGIDAATGKASRFETSIGIVDPFLKESVKKGERFYMFLYPGSITSLRHDWTHAAFKAPETMNEGAARLEKAASEKWLRDYANDVNSHYEGEEAYQLLLSDLENKTLTYRGTSLYDESGILHKEDLSYHAGVVLGRRVDFGDFEHFSCTC